MILAELKRQCLLWGYTIAALLLLFVVGVLLSLWLGSQPSPRVDLQTANSALGGWRIGLYCLLVGCWPRCVAWLMNRRFGAVYPVSRKPHVLLILLYEGLIVQNPLAILLSWEV